MIFIPIFGRLPAIDITLLKMNTNLLNEYVINHLKSVENSLVAYKITREKKYLHKLRVDIKKIRAMFSFIKKMYNIEYDLLNLMHLFRESGGIRDIQIIILLLNTLPKAPEKVIAQLHKKEERLIKKFLKNTALHVKAIRFYHENISLPEKLPDKKTIRKYLKKILQKAIKNIHGNDRNSMHRFRMRIKKIIYIYQALPENTKKYIRLNKSNLNKLQELMGDWHDTYFAIHFFMDQHIFNKTPDILKLKEKEDHQFNALKEKITDASFYSKIFY